MPTSRRTTKPAGFSLGVRRLTEFLKDRRASTAGRRDLTDAVMVVRFADFDEVICTLGHDHALSLMHAFAQQLRRQLREQDVICVLSERDLGLVLPGLANRSVTLLAVHKIRCCLEDCFRGIQPAHPVRTYFGTTIMAGEELHPYEFIRHAYIAMLKAEKENIPFIEYCSEDARGLREALEIEKELRIFAGDYPFEPYLQPQLDLQTGVICGAEVLLRWNSPRFGAVSPAVFVPIAESKGLINGITEWVLQKACHGVDGLLRHNPRFNLAVNISPMNLSAQAFPQFVEECLSIWNVLPQAITLELTEGAMVEDPRGALERLTRLKQLGVKLSIDDFGTGYSSLQYLRRLPVDEVKIDQSFIRGMMGDERNRSIVNTVVDLAHNFALDVVAEGVEDEASLDYLREIGCHKAQGYFISKPMPEADFQGFLRAHG